MPFTTKMSMTLHGSSAPRFVPPSFQPARQLPRSNLGVALNLSSNTRSGMSMGMLNRIQNARPGCSSCGGGPH